MAIRKVNSSSLRIPTKAYSQGVIIPLGAADLMFVSGQLAQDREGNVLEENNARKQTEIIFERIKQILAEGSMGLEDIVKVQIFVTDMERYGQEVSDARNEILKDIRPASTLVAINAPAKAGCVVEIEATAVKLH